jgi:protein phosphatase
MFLLREIASLFGRSAVAMAGLSDSGLQREQNEDALLVIPEAGLMCVCDGMGGHNGGVLDDARLAAMNEQAEAVQPALIEACQVAHRRLKEIGEQDESLRGMGSTVVMAFIASGVLHVTHVGDSRAYRSGDSLELLTEDHSHCMQMVKAGRLSLEELRTHPDRNWINQALGGGAEIHPSYAAFPLAHRDRVLLCSDGVWDMVPGPKIHEIVREAKSPVDGCRALIAEANSAGGEDNITACLYFCP